LSNKKALLSLAFIWMVMLTFFYQRNSYSAQLDKRHSSAERSKQNSSARHSSSTRRNKKNSSAKRSSSTRHSKKNSSSARTRHRISRPRSAFTLNGESAKEAPPPSNDFCLGVREFHRGNYPQARSYLETAKSDFPDLQDYVLYYLGRSQEELRDQQQAISTFQMLLSQYPQSRFTPKATLKVADLLFFLKKYDNAREYYQKSLDIVPDRREYILFQTALSWIDEKNWAEARTVLKKILIQFPDGEFAKLSVLCNKELEKEYHLQPLSFSEEEQMDLIQANIKEHRYTQALDLIAQFRKTPSLSPNCRAHLLSQEAYCYSKSGQKDLTLETLQKLVRLYPSSDDVADSLLIVGNLLWNQDKDADAIEAYEKVVKDFDKRAGTADKAWFLMGRIHEQSRDYQEAISCFENLVRDFSKSSYYPEAIWRIGWDYYQQGKFKEAGLRFKNGLTKVDDPSDRHQFLYWQAKAAEKSQDSSGAMELYRAIAGDTYYSYYSWLSQQRVEGCSPPPLQESFPGQGEVITVSYSEEVYFHLARAKKLLEYHMKEEAFGEIKILVDEHESDPWYWYNLSKLAARAGLGREAILAGFRCQQSLVRQGKSEGYADVLELLYPLNYWDHIQKYADRYGVDPLVVCALMRQESMFDPMSLSGAHAYGLMQIIPSTARMIASKVKAFGSKNFNVERLYDPETNIAFGTWYLADLLQKFEDNLVYALISYNAGEDALLKWRNQYRTASLDEFVEMISYKETRNYVKKVIRNYGHYVWLYNKPASSSSPRQVKKLGSQAGGEGGEGKVSGAGDQGVGGAGAADQKIGGAGAADQKIGGAGAADQGVGGTNAADQEIGGAGAADQGVGGTNAADQEIEGAGAGDQGVGGAGAGNQGVGGAGAGDQGVGGAGAGDQGVGGAGAGNQGIGG